MPFAKFARLSSLLFLTLLLAAPSFSQAQASWVEQRSGIAGMAAGQSLAFGNGRFVAVFRTADYKHTVATSTDGFSWTALPAVAVGREQAQHWVTFTKGQFVLAIANTLYRSADGLSWDQASVFAANTNLRFPTGNDRGGLMISTATASAPLWVSEDGVAFRNTSPLPQFSLPSLTIVSKIQWFNGRYFVYYHEQSSTQLIPRIASTADFGANWQSFPTDFTPSRSEGFTSGGGLILVTRANDYATSEDGMAFTSFDLPSGFNNQSSPVSFAGGRFISTVGMVASVDGRTWSSLGVGGLAVGAGIVEIAHGNGRYVGIGTRSASGNTWQDAVFVLIASAPPIVASQPVSRSVFEGRPVEFSTAISNADLPATYQWRHDGEPIAGATSPTLALSSVSLTDAGKYDCVITNSEGSVRTDAATLTVLPFSSAGRIVNVSVLTPLDADEKMTVGFVLGGGPGAGAGFLARAGGPSLAAFGVGGAHPDPRLRYFRGSDLLVENDDWGGTTELTTIASAVGAFAFTSPTSRDAAGYAVLTPGSHTVEIAGATGTSGTVIAEVYDVVPQSAVTSATPRLVNVSVLKRVAPGRGVTAGFVVRGETAVSVVVRAIGPTLANHGVASVNADTRVELYRGGTSTPIATNDNWGGTAALEAAMASVGAFPLPADSKDAVLTATLEPGQYTAVVNAVGSADGAALVEVYQVP